MKNKSTLISAICSVSFIAINMIILIAIVLQPAPTKIVVPSKRQLAWHKNEQCAFVHFGMNTFTNQD
ncbi:hypothetical protein FACS1894166_00680 [Bacilli bacterium]|nr:hypothetical protein FACS1894166_00680 [Bacilli bacterium]